MGTSVHNFGRFTDHQLPLGNSVCPYQPMLPEPGKYYYRIVSASTPDHRVRSSQHIARHWAMCEWFDETCGELFDLLEGDGLSQNTIVLFVVDNGGEQSPDRATFAPKNKTTPFDLGHRTPIMVSWPGKVKPSRNQSVASSIDIVPSVLAAVDLPSPTGLHGVNLLVANATQSRTHVFGECFTVRSQTLDDPSANLLWRWSTDGRWRLILPRTVILQPITSLRSARGFRCSSICKTILEKLTI
jgi:uncharacterized sulfatase